MFDLHLNLKFGRAFTKPEQVGQVLENLPILFILCWMYRANMRLFTYSFIYLFKASAVLFNVKQIRERKLKLKCSREHN